MRSAVSPSAGNRSIEDASYARSADGSRIEGESTAAAAVSFLSITVSSKSEQLLDPVFLQACSDDDDTSGIVRGTGADLCFLRDHVKVDPCAVLTRDHTLGTKDESVIIFRGVSKSLQDASDLIIRVGLRRLSSPALEDLVRIMSAMMMVVVMMVMGVVDDRSVLIRLMFMLMMVMMVFMLVLILIIMVVMVVMMVLMLVLILIIMVVMMVMMVLMFVLILVIMIVMVMMVLMFILILVIIMMMVMFFFLRQQQICQGD